MKPAVFFQEMSSSLFVSRKVEVSQSMSNHFFNKNSIVKEMSSHHMYRRSDISNI